MKGPLLALAPMVIACGWGTGGATWNAAGATGCHLDGLPHALPDALSESSGAAWSKITPGIWFTHNDGGHEEEVYVLDGDGVLIGNIPLLGLVNQDWEDLATGSCPEGACIYLADTGDNQEIRERIILYRLPDPGVYDGSPQKATTFPMILPDGPRDIEALFVIPGEQVFLVSKGRNHGPTLYRYPPPLREGEDVVLQAIQQFNEHPLPIPEQITGADASPDGRVVAIRSYRALQFYSWKGPPHENDGLEPMEEGSVALRTLNEAQGEALGLGAGGRVVLTSEAVLGRGAIAHFLNCPDILGSG